MAIKSLQLKKFPVKQLKKIVKDNKLGKITKKKKTQLIAMIQNAENLKQILSSLTMPIKKARPPPSAAQLASRKAFGDKMRNKKKPENPVGSKKTLSPKKLIGGNPATFTPKNLPQPVIEAKKIVEKIDKQVDLTPKQEKKMESVVKEMSKKAFLDSIFGVSLFNFESELIKVVNEMDDENKLNKFLSKSKTEMKKLLRGRFNSSQSITRFIKSI